MTSTLTRKECIVPLEMLNELISFHIAIEAKPLAIFVIFCKNHYDQAGGGLFPKGRKTLAHCRETAVYP